ncbi:hypothetical protein D3C78_1324430 [compost metagenome]
MGDRNMLEARIIAFFTRPEQKRQIHHRIDDRPTRLVAGPGSNELSCRVVPARQIVGGEQPAPPSVRVAGQLVADNRCRQELKANIVVEMVVPQVTLLHAFVPRLRLLPITLLSGHIVQNPQNARPEA